ncbi:hypothetical protein Rhe02_87540 [Rhizocola hellebori]|uniref:Uncharacterized protein n=1 Tax=Rhizocola hellebori TaxID=1392758 RepID=A0A8J3QJA4_9ACTN|nr:hypothetical protein [Rhizocola hellebori]GIH10687.1 hypothetical protein Rhe02_87540 [Rhizocola hellebori]
MRKRIARRAGTAVMLIAAATLVTASQATTAYAKPCTELWMQVGMDVELSMIATLVGDDSGQGIRGYSVRMETTPTAKFVVVTLTPTTGVCGS